MTSHEIFARMSPAQASQIFQFLYEKEKPLYKATIETLAKQRKLRAIFVERKPREERFAWMQDVMGRKPGDAVAAHVLQVWLVSQQSQLLCDFLDALGIKHDDDGTVESLPSAPSRMEIDKAVEAVLARHPAEAVAVYLHAFQALDDEHGWNTLDEVLASDARLQLGAVPSVSSAA